MSNKYEYVNTYLVNIKTVPDYQTWMAANSQYLVEIKDVTSEELYACKIDSLGNKEQVTWLINNTPYINFTKTYPYILLSHDLEQLPDYLSIEENLNKEVKSGKAFSKSIEDILTDLQLPNFNGYAYDSYISYGATFKTVSSQNLIDDVKYFSFPFFQAIMAEYKKVETKSIVLYFSTNGTFAYKIVNKTTSVGSFYDLSYQPPNGGRVGVE